MTNCFSILKNSIIGLHGRRSISVYNSYLRRSHIFIFTQLLASPLILTISSFSYSALQTIMNFLPTSFTIPTLSGNSQLVVRRLERGLFIGFLIITSNTIVTQGFGAVVKDAVRLFRRLPLVNSLLNIILDGEVKGALKMLSPGGGEGGKEKAEDALTAADTPVLEIPKSGLDKKKVMEIMTKLHAGENATEEGKAFAYTYTSDKDLPEFSEVLGEAFALYADKSGSGDKAHENMMTEVWKMYMHTNALNPMLIPSLRKLETEVVSMTAWMLNGDSAVAGSLTSGGTESILMAIKTYRDRARKLYPHITKPNMVVPTTIHPAFEKAGHYFDVELIHVELAADFRVNVDAVRKAINHNTILIVGSAPQYCHGVVDPIEELAQIAVSRGIGMHVDACYGGFMLPWLEKNGVKVPKWDFRVPGVTSISADVHKYGYSSKGCSIIVYKDAELRSHQYFAYANWPGGLFGSPSMAGSRPGGMVAAAWAAMVSMGQDGYMKLAASIMETTLKIAKAVEDIDGLELLGNNPPAMTALAIASNDSLVDILAVADIMEESGWKMERQQLPDSLHMSVLPQHKNVVDQLVKDLAAAVVTVRKNKQAGKVHKGSAGVYGMVASIPDKELVNDFLIKMFGALYTADHTGGKKGAADSSNSIIEKYSA